MPTHLVDIFGYVDRASVYTYTADDAVARCQPRFSYNGFERINNSFDGTFDNVVVDFRDAAFLELISAQVNDNVANAGTREQQNILCIPRILQHLSRRLCVQTKQTALLSQGINA